MRYLRFALFLFLLGGVIIVMQKHSVKADTFGVPALADVPVGTLRYFAEIDTNKKVLRVIVADPDFINSGAVGNPANWVETKIDGTARKNYAGIGYTYDTAIDGFVPPKPAASWILNTSTAEWQAPKSEPTDKTHSYTWDEKNQQFMIDK